MSYDFFLTRTQLEEREKLILAPFAVKSIESQGRKHEEHSDKTRTCFQHDRDRIIHTKSFRRLKGKTQVFVAHHGDHYRSRLTHTMEVAQLARDMARTMALNEDLAEAIALAHDLGHTPFGHAGEQSLNECMHRHGGSFEHNAQSRRIVEFLEHRYPDFPGLNLTEEVLEGLGKHRSAYDYPVHSPSMELPSLESQVVNIADEIAYQNHDIDDGLRSGILLLSDLEKLELWQQASKNIPNNLSEDIWIHRCISSLIKIMVTDVVEETAKRLQKHKISSPEDILKCKTPLVGFCEEITQQNSFLRQFLMLQFYKQPAVVTMSEYGKTIIKQLFFIYTKKKELLPKEVQEKLEFEPEIVVIRDYIAGMTDSFAEVELEKISQR